MKFTPVADPLPGERTAAVAPTPAPLVDWPWTRPRYVTGRSVSDTALAAEQRLREGRSTLIGQVLDPGVVDGLDARVGEDGRIEVAAGYGLCGTGEDIVLPSPTALSATALPVRLPETLAPELVAATLTELLEALDGQRLADGVIDPPPIAVEPVIEVQSWYVRALDSDAPIKAVQARADLAVERAKLRGEALDDARALVESVDATVRYARLTAQVDKIEVIADEYAALAGPVLADWAKEDASRVYGPIVLPEQIDKLARIELAIDGLASPSGGLHSVAALEKAKKDAQTNTDPLALEVAAKARRIEAEKIGRTLGADEALELVTLDLGRAALDREPAAELAETIAAVSGRAAEALLERWDEAVATGAGKLGATPTGAEIRERTLGEIALEVIAGTYTLEQLEEDVESPPPLVPVAVVLIAEPVYVDDLGAAGPPTDPCERDIDAEPFEDWRYTDGTGFAWVPVEAWLAEVVPELTFDAWWAGVMAGPRTADGIRNRLAWALFELELTAPTPPPWARDGVPVALAAFACDGTLLFLDRHAVRRLGGRRIQRSAPAPISAPTARQARIDQFQDQLADLQGLTADTRLVDTFRYLPPVGVLPLALFDLTGRTTRCFPSGWGLNAAPAPLEQVEAALRQAESLAPFDLSADGDELKLLVPVGQDQWDPGLLRVQAIAEDFHAALREARDRLDVRMAAVAELRAKIDALYLAVGGPDALPVRAVDDTPEAAAERVAAADLWRNPAALAEIASQAVGDDVPDGGAADGAPAEAPDPPFSGPEGFEPLLEAVLGPAGATLAAAYAIVRQPVAGTDTRARLSADGPVVVIPVPSSDPPSTLSGAGFAVPGGWSHARTAPDDPFPAWREAPRVVLVRGEADTEAIDRAVAAAAGASLVVLATGLGAAAREELDWRYVHAADAGEPPLMVVLPLDPTADADILEDLAVRLGATALAGAPDGHREQITAVNAVGGVAATATTLTVVDCRAPAAPTTARVAEILAALPGLGAAGSPAVVRAEGRARTLLTSAAAVRWPDTTREDGTREPEHARFAARVVDALRAVAAADGAEALTANGLVAAVANEATWGTVPAPAGLAVELVDDLIERLRAMRSPRSDAPVLSEAELNLVLGAVEGDVVGVGLGGFAAVMEEKANRADDAVDFAFVRVQAAIFRLRELLLGRDRATRMASSPVLAEVSDLIRAEATPAQLGAFFGALHGGASLGGTPGGTPGTPGGGTSGGGSGPIRGPGDLPEITDVRMFDILGGLDPSDPIAHWVGGGIDLSSRFGDALDDAVSSGAFDVAPVFAEADAAKDIGVDIGAAIGGGAGLDIGAASGSTRGDAASAGGKATGGVIGASGASEVLGGSKGSGSIFDAVSSKEISGQKLGASGLKLSGAGVGLGNVGARIGGLGGLHAGDVGEAQAAAPFTGGFDALSVPSLLAAPMVTQSTAYTIAKVVDSVSYVQALRPVEFVTRTTGIATRLEDPPAAEIAKAAYTLRASVVQTLGSLELDLSEVPMPLLVGNGKGDARVFTVEWHALGDRDDTLTDVPEDDRPTYAQSIIAGTHDATTSDPDQAALFSDASRNLESVAGMLRVAEAQVRLVREAVETARRARTVLLQLIGEAEARERALGDALAEARQDLLSTGALLAEEQERVDEINARRARVLAEAIPFVVFHRVREVDLRDATPVHDLVPAMRSDPAVEALSHPAQPAPAELHDAVDLFRDAPARWLVALAPALEQIDRVDALRRTLDGSRTRAIASATTPRTAPTTLIGLRGLEVVTGLTASRRVALGPTRAPAAALRPDAIGRMTWKQALVTAKAVISLGDLADGVGAPAAVSRAASEELDHIHTVAAALYHEVSAVEPRIRAAWVARISQFDRPLPLHDLAVLPAWAEVGAGATSRPDPFAKRELQALVDWLFGRVSADEPEAEALVSDLVRVAILLASHAPVGRILAGRLDARAPATPGGRLSVSVDAERLRVGMVALVLSGAAVRARAVVEDLGYGRAVARIVSGSPSAVLEAGDTVRFVESDGVTLAEGAAAQPASSRPLAALVDPPSVRAWFTR